MKSLKFTALAMALSSITSLTQAEILSAQSYSKYILAKSGNLPDYFPKEYTKPQPSLVLILPDGREIEIPFKFYEFGKDADSNRIVVYSAKELLDAEKINAQKESEQNCDGCIDSTNDFNSLGFLNAVGEFNFQNVANGKVYFGEWSNPVNEQWSDRVVFYAGDDSNRVLPTTEVNYKVQGINKYTGNNQMSGELTASFNMEKPTLTGTLRNDTQSISLNATINTADASFNGTAQARHLSTDSTPVSGTTEGHFFGANESASLAGIAKFDDRNFDTAFGGTIKN